MFLRPSQSRISIINGSRPIRFCAFNACNVLLTCTSERPVASAMSVWVMWNFTGFPVSARPTAFMRMVLFADRCPMRSAPSGDRH